MGRSSQSRCRWPLIPASIAKRLASAGQSGGATVTMLLVAVDQRLSTAVVCSGNTENLATGSLNSPGSTDDAEQDFVDSGPVGFDRWDLFYPFAPKPMLITASDKDYFWHVLAGVSDERLGRVSKAEESL